MHNDLQVGLVGTEVDLSYNYEVLLIEPSTFKLCNSGDEWCPNG